MTGDLSIKLVAQNDHILTLVRQRPLAGTSGVPDPCFGHEVEACAMNNGSAFSVGVRSEEDGGPENTLEGIHQSPVLRAPCCIPNRASISAALSNVILGIRCRIAIGRKKNRDEPVLSPGEAVARVSSHL
jgi:hypothetical protein